MPSGSHDINVKLLALMGIVSTILVVALVVATQAWFRYEFAQEYRRKVVEIPYAEPAELETAQLAALHGSSDAAMPIDEAMQRVIQKYGSGE